MIYHSEEMFIEIRVMKSNEVHVKMVKIYMVMFNVAILNRPK